MATALSKEVTDPRVPSDTEPCQSDTESLQSESSSSTYVDRVVTVFRIGYDNCKECTSSPRKSNLTCRAPVEEQRKDATPGAPKKKGKKSFRPSKSGLGDNTVVSSRPVLRPCCASQKRSAKDNETNLKVTKTSLLHSSINDENHDPRIDSFASDGTVDTPIKLAQRPQLEQELSVEEVLIVEPPIHHVKQVRSVPKENSCNNEDDNDVCLVGSTGTHVLIDFPHARENCVLHPMGRGDPSQYCSNCYCYVCDIPAKDCSSWTQHCHAKYDKKGDSKWWNERNRVRRVGERH